MPPLTSVEGWYSLKSCSHTQRRSFFRSSESKSWREHSETLVLWLRHLQTSGDDTGRLAKGGRGIHLPGNSAPIPGPSSGSSIATMWPYQIGKSNSGSRQIPKYKSRSRPTGPGTLHDVFTYKILLGRFCKISSAPYCGRQPCNGPGVTICGRELKISTQRDGSLIVRVLDSVPCLGYLVPQSPVLHMPPLTSVEGAALILRGEASGGAPRPNGGEKQMHHGGSAILVSDKCGVPCRPLSITSPLQVTALKIHLQCTYTICSIYLPPSTPIAREDLINKTTAIDISLRSADSLLDFDWRVTDNFRGSNHYHILLSSLEVLLTPRVPHWRLDKADWDLFKELAKVDRNIEEFPSVDEAVEYLTSFLQWAGSLLLSSACSLVVGGVQPGRLIMAAQLPPLKKLQKVLPVFAGVSSMVARSTELKAVSRVEESRNPGFWSGTWRDIQHVLSERNENRPFTHWRYITRA
ncbi:putative RNA-directed DNA polymerase from mobile element jockey-like 86, partial [Homarus americanus]